MREEWPAMLKFIYENEADIPAHAKANYAQNGDGHWVLQVEGAVSKKLLDEFRENNTKHLKKIQELETRFKDIDPDEARKLKDIKDQLDEGKIVKNEALEAAVAKRAEKMRAEHEKQLAELTGKLKGTTEEMARLKIDSALAAEGTKLGLLPAALPDFINRGREVFKLDEATGKVRAFDKDGQIKFGNSATELTIPEFVKDAAGHADFKHLFAASTGAGSAGGGKTSGAGVNPFKKDSYNMTEQARIIRENPQQAKQLAAEAGTALPGMV